MLYYLETLGLSGLSFTFFECKIRMFMHLKQGEKDVHLRTVEDNKIINQNTLLVAKFKSFLNWLLYIIGAFVVFHIISLLFFKVSII